MLAIKAQGWQNPGVQQTLVPTEPAPDTVELCLVPDCDQPALPPLGLCTRHSVEWMEARDE